MKTDRLLAAIDADPNSSELYRNLGTSHFNEGKPGESLGAFLMALALAPSDHENRKNAMKLLGMTSGYQVPGPIRAILAECAWDPDLDTQALASVIHSEFANGSLADLLTDDLMLAGRAKVRGDLASGAYDNLFEDGLLKSVMTGAILVTPSLERCLTALRCYFLETLLENDKVPDDFMLEKADFLSALACQCFNTEYVYSVTSAESDAVERLVLNTGPDTDIVTLSILGCYRHLHDLPAISVPDPSGLSLLQGRMVERLINEPRRETEIACQIPSLGEVQDATSQAIQAQYQIFPYPRWTSAEAVTRPLRFGKYIRQRFPLVREKQVPKGPIGILVAGCGTGKQAIEVATAYKGAVVTAVDLSRASLAYAKARSDERGLDNINFIQGDILQLGDLDQQFDLIECMGVLHHMADPQQGLSVLKGLLKPNGFLRLALYSSRARSEVEAASAFAKDLGIDDSPSSMRDFRQKVYGLPPDQVVSKVVETRDFFSMSGLHDYVFNVHEQAYTPLALKSLLDQAQLEFLGFDLPTMDVDTDYRKVNPADRFLTDLKAWERFETDHPDTFAAMFQFWCRAAPTRL